MKRRIRTCIFRPYQKGMGPSFILHMFENTKDAFVYVGRGNWTRPKVGYELRVRENGKSVVLFQGDDYMPSPLHDPDSDTSVSHLIGFLTSVGESYNEAQVNFCRSHGETLRLCVDDRFGEKQ